MEEIKTLLKVLRKLMSDKNNQLFYNNLIRILINIF